MLALKFIDVFVDEREGSIDIAPMHNMNLAVPNLVEQLNATVDVDDVLVPVPIVEETLPHPGKCVIKIPFFNLHALKLQVCEMSRKCINEYFKNI